MKHQAAKLRSIGRAAPVAFAALVSLIASGCIGIITTPSVGEISVSQECLPLYQSVSLNPVRGKMPILPTDIPTRAMLMVAEAPSNAEVQAIKQLEEADRACKQLGETNGRSSSATEDILASRISRLRYGLFNGEIPFAVYNFGVAKAIKEQIIFAIEGQDAYARGEEVGGQRALAHIQLLSTQNQINNMQNRLNQYNMNSSRSWNCDFSTLATSDTVYYNCY